MQIERLAKAGSQTRDLSRLEQARRSTADVERRHARPTEALALAPDLELESLHVPRPKRAPRRRRREVAIGTSRSAERDVDVEPERCGRATRRNPLYARNPVPSGRGPLARGGPRRVARASLVSHRYPVHLRIAPRRSGSSASADSSDVFPRSTSHSRDSCTKARRCEGRQSDSSTTRSSPNSGSRSTYAMFRSTSRAPDTP